MIKFIRNIPWKEVGIIILLAALALGAIVGIGAALTNKTKTVSDFVFAKGELDGDGHYVESVRSICTKELIECQGLKIEPDFDATGTYQVFYYGSDKQFIGATEKFVTAETPIYEKGNTFAMAKYCRIVITPDVPKDEYGFVEEDYKINFYEITGIAGKFNITVNKKQNFVDPSTVDLIEKNDAELGVGYSVGDDNKLVPETKPAGMTVIVDVSFMEELTFKFGSADAVVNHFIDAGGNVLSSVLVFEGDTDRVVAVPDGAVYLYCFMAQDNPYSVFQTK